jgi:hypothetical protein
MTKKLFVTGPGRKIWAVEFKGVLGSWVLPELPDLPGVTYWAVYQEIGETRELSAMRYCFPLVDNKADTKRGYKVKSDHKEGGTFRLHSSVKAAANVIHKDIEDAFQRHSAQLMVLRTNELVRLATNLSEL